MRKVAIDDKVNEDERSSIHVYRKPLTHSELREFTKR